MKTRARLSIRPALCRFVGVALGGAMLLSLGGCVLYATRPKPPEQAPLGAYAPPPPLRR